jgi:DhnA family fructose-bisphosphate aldolase class Ia
LTESVVKKFLLRSDGRCIDVALDHAAFGGAGLFHRPVPELAALVAAAGADAIQLTPEDVERYRAHQGGPHQPPVALRADAANLYDETAETLTVSRQTLTDRHLGAASCLVANLFRISGSDRGSDVESECRRQLDEIARLARAWDLPLMIEALVLTPEAGRYAGSFEPADVIGVTKAAVSAGADILKVDPTRRPEDFTGVIEAAEGRPVLVRGGERVDDRVLLERTARLMDAGAAGVVYGRNVFQHPRPEAILRALAAIVHDGATVTAALQIVASGPEA